MKVKYSIQEYRSAVEHIHKLHDGLFTEARLEDILMDLIKRPKKYPDVTMVSTAGFTVNFDYDPSGEECIADITVSPCFGDHDYLTI